MDWQGMFFPRALMRRRRPAVSVGEPSPEDIDRLRELREAGSRVDLPHPVRCFLAFEAEADARAAIDALERDGRRARIRAEPDGSWTLTVVEMTVPTPGAITRLRETMTAVAEERDGAFLGWTAPVVY